jgi:hypothetical protein
LSILLPTLGLSEANFLSICHEKPGVNVENEQNSKKIRDDSCFMF